jgi:hypothetical protein
VCSSGVFEGEQFQFLDKSVRAMKGDFIDEHYYQTPKWFMDNATRYDKTNERVLQKYLRASMRGKVMR